MIQRGEDDKTKCEVRNYAYVTYYSKSWRERERERDRRLSSANEKVVTTPFDRLCLTPFRLITTHFENRFQTRDLA